MLGAIVPAHTWFGALMSVLGVAMLESSGSPPNVSIDLVLSGFSSLRFVEHANYENDTLVEFVTLSSSLHSNYYQISCDFIHSLQVGDLLNFLSAIFFGIHMLRTEHISRSTDKENFLPLLGYEVS